MGRRTLIGNAIRLERPRKRGAPQLLSEKCAERGEPAYLSRRPWLLPSANESGYPEAPGAWGHCSFGDLCTLGHGGDVPPDERMTILPSGKRACARCSGNYAGLADKRNGWIKGQKSAPLPAPAP